MDKSRTPYEIIDDLLITFVFKGNDIPSEYEGFHIVQESLRSLAEECKRNPNTPLTVATARYLKSRQMIA